MVRVRKTKELDKLEGKEKSKELSDEILREYIDNDFFRLSELDTRQLSKELPISRRDRDVSVDVYLKFMEDYLNRIRLGRIPDKSYLVSAVDGFGKKVFVYQAIKDALRHGLRPSKLLDSHELYELLDSRKYTEFNEHFNDVDMAFITLGGAPSNTAIIVMKTALEYCERKGVPLLIISRFEPEMFHKIDIVTTTYIGVKASRKGDFGVMELAGFNGFNMSKIKDEIRNRSGVKGENFRKLKNQN